MKGVLLQVGRATVVAGGIALSFVNLLGGTALTVAGTRFLVEDAMINDPKIQDIISTVQKIDFSPLYKKIE